MPFGLCNALIRPKSITILYCDFTLFIDIFHFKVLFLCCFGLFYTVYNFPVPKQQNQDSAVKKWKPSCGSRISPNAVNIYGDHFYARRLGTTGGEGEGTHQAARRVPGGPSRCPLSPIRP